MKYCFIHMYYRILRNLVPQSDQHFLKFVRKELENGKSFQSFTNFLPKEQLEGCFLLQHRILRRKIKK